MERKKFIINIPSELHSDLKTVAFLRNLSMTDVILEKVKEVIEEEKRKGNFPVIKRKES